jgi:DNA-binding IclR family transcriptional regulator
MGMRRANPVASGEIAASLNLDPEEVARHLHALAQKGMVRMNGSQVQLAVAAPEVKHAAVNEVELAQ